MWRFGLVGNVVGRIKEVNQRRAWLVLGWVTVCRRLNNQTNHPCQLSLAICLVFVVAACYLGHVEKLLID